MKINKYCWKNSKIVFISWIKIYLHMVFDYHEA